MHFNFYSIFWKVKRLVHVFLKFLLKILKTEEVSPCILTLSKNVKMCVKIALLYNIPKYNNSNASTLELFLMTNREKSKKIHHNKKVKNIFKYSNLLAKPIVLK